MKKIILSVAVLAFSMTFAQKKEVKNAFSAIESNDVAKANDELGKAEALLGEKLYLLEPEQQEQYYYAKGMALIKAGKTSEGANYLAKIGDLGKQQIFTGRNADKQKVYFVGKAEADKNGAGLDLKATTYAPTTAALVGPAINPILQKANEEAMNAYNAKNYTVSGEKFLLVYNLLKAAGNDDKTFKYYSAISYALGQKNPEAIKVFSELIDEGYTGVKTEYKAKNKKSGAVETFDKNTFTVIKASSDYTDFKEETTKSVEHELYETNAALLLDTEKYDEALAVIEKGLKKFPNNNRLSELQGTAYFKSGKTDQFIETLKTQLAKNPNDKVGWYNLGVLASKDPSKLTDAENYFKKALEVDPNYIPALQAMFYNVYMGDDKKVIDEAEAARKAKKMDVFDKILADRRARFAKGLPYLEKWYSLAPKDLDLVSLLKGVYQTTRNEAKAAEFKALEASLKGGK